MTNGLIFIDIEISLREWSGSAGSRDDPRPVLLHDALQRFLRYRKTLSHRGAELSYLRRTIRTTAIDAARAERSRARRLADYAAAVATEPATGTGGDELEKAVDSLVAWLRHSIALLPPLLCEAAEAVIVRGESQRGFAERRQLPYSTVKSRVQQARARLAELADACCVIERDGRGGIMGVRPRCCG